MKKRFLFVTALLLCFMPLKIFSQTAVEFQDNFSAGPMIGLNITNIAGAGDAGSKTGFDGGGFIVYSFQEHFGVNTAIFYSAEGANYTFVSVSELSTVITDYSTRLNYIRIPVLANVFFGRIGDVFRPKVMLGPSVGFLIGAKSDISTATTTGSASTITNVTRDMKDDFKSVDVGAVIGAGFNYRLADVTWLNMDVNYYIGASDIRNIKPIGSDSMKNRGFSLNAGIAFGL